jgi:hypothetical protein
MPRFSSDDKKNKANCPPVQGENSRAGGVISAPAQNVILFVFRENGEDFARHRHNQDNDLAESSLGKVILMILSMSFFEQALGVEYKTAWDLLYSMGQGQEVKPCG